MTEPSKDIHVQADVLRLLKVEVDAIAPRGWEWTARVHEWDERIPLGRGGSPQEAIEALADALDEHMTSAEIRAWQEAHK